MQPLARNLTFYGFLPSNNSEQVLLDSLHYANGVFLMSGKSRQYGRSGALVTNGKTGCERIEGGTVVWGSDDQEVADLIADATGFLVVFTKNTPGKKVAAAVKSVKSQGRDVYELSALTVPHRLVVGDGGCTLESYRSEEGVKAFHPMPAPKAKKKPAAKPATENGVEA